MDKGRATRPTVIQFSVNNITLKVVNLPYDFLVEAVVLPLHSSES